MSDYTYISTTLPGEYLTAVPKTIEGIHIPGPLMRAVEEHAEALDIVYKCIIGLPKPFKDLMTDYFDFDLSVECLDNLAAGMRCLLDNRLPTKDSLHILACPRDMLNSTASGLRAAAACEPMATQIGVRPIIQMLSEQLELIATGMTWQGTYGVEQWAYKVSAQHFPSSNNSSPTVA